jgi:hypothetical protein
MNTNPVHIGLILRQEPKLLENIKKVARVLELMSDKQFKAGFRIRQIIRKYLLLLLSIFDNVSQ